MAVGKGSILRAANAGRAQSAVLTPLDSAEMRTKFMTEIREEAAENESKKTAEGTVQTADSRAGQSNRTGAGAGNVSTWKEIFLPDTLTFICRHFLLLQNGLSKGVQSGKRQ